MTIKHAPATPLPWKVKGNARNLTVTGKLDRSTGQRPFVDEIPLEAWGDEAKRLRQDLSYAFFAANAYPKLVEKLRLLADASAKTLEYCPDMEWRTNAHIETIAARHLLRVLGESK